MKKLAVNFYRKDTLTVAKALLGKYLTVRTDDDEELVVRIVETEAYIGPHDRACHTYGGRRTERTEIMYRHGGYTYIYQIYGMYYCLNIVTEDDTAGTAVLIRAAEPVSGFDIMAYNRYKLSFAELSRKQQINIANGPGKLCRALNLTKSSNGIDLTGNKIFISEDEEEPEYEIASAKRIGIDYAGEAKDFEWRFYIKGSLCVSKI